VATGPNDSDLDVQLDVQLDLEPHALLAMGSAA
jgi:hypothetical protein